MSAEKATLTSEEVKKYKASDFTAELKGIVKQMELRIY